jgi:hypothetical protein
MTAGGFDICQSLPHRTALTVDALAPPPVRAGALTGSSALTPVGARRAVAERRQGL